MKHKKLFEIERWGHKKVKRYYTDNDEQLYETIDFTAFWTTYLQELIKNEYDKPVWEEAVTLPGFNTWQAATSLTLGSSAITRKELLRRYIQDLAGRVNGNWDSTWKINNLPRYYIVYNQGRRLLDLEMTYDHQADTTYFNTKTGANIVIDHAIKELKELFDIKEN